MSFIENEVENIINATIRGCGGFLRKPYDEEVYGMAHKLIADIRAAAER